MVWNPCVTPVCTNEALPIPIDQRQRGHEA